MKNLKWHLLRATDIVAEALAAALVIFWAASWVTLVLGAPFIVIGLFLKLMGWL